MVREWNFDEYVIVDANISVSPAGYEGTVLLDRAIWPPIARMKGFFPFVLYSIPLDFLWYEGEARVITPYLLEIRSASVSGLSSRILGAIIKLNCPANYSSSIKSQAQTYDKIKNGEYDRLLQSVYYKYKIKGYGLI